MAADHGHQCVRPEKVQTDTQGVNPATTLLFQHLRDHHDPSDFAADFPPPRPFPHADPYLLTSAMQKAVRRGNVEIARRAGHQLLVIDRSRLWRRLAVVALEDIGIADIDVAAELVGIATMPAARRLLGGDTQALDITLVRACSAAKDRTGDHFTSIIGREPIDDADRDALQHASGNAMLAVIASSQLPWTRRLRAAVIASGRSEPGHPGAPGTGAVLEVFRELGVPPLLIAVCQAYAARQRDLLPVLVPIAAILHVAGSTNGQVIAHDLPTPELIGHWPSYVFDPINTRLGRRAVDLWLRSYWTKPPYTSRQVAACLGTASSPTTGSRPTDRDDLALAWKLSRKPSGSFWLASPLI